VPLAAPIHAPARSDPTVRAIARSWRRLTGGTARGGDAARRTLIACSGGGDSSGLTLALAAAVSHPRDLLVVGHIVHDLRPEAEALADRDAARELAAALGLAFVEARIWPRQEGGNAEAAARRLRYQALAGLADDAGCPFIATAHHAQDQLETLVMGLIRGAGPRGLAGVAPVRRVGKAGLIRPALTTCGPDLRRLCTQSGWTWREDATNADRSRLRAAVRHQILPLLEALRPGVAIRAARSSELLRGAAGVLDEAASSVLASGIRNDGLEWDRARLRRERPVVLGAALRLAAGTLLAGEGSDRRTAQTVDPVVRAIKDRGGSPRRFEWLGLVIEVTTDRVRVRKRPHA
jgi:tRNA(Ile)-lysidine synthase